MHFWSLSQCNKIHQEQKLTSHSFFIYAYIEVIFYFKFQWVQIPLNIKVWLELILDHTHATCVETYVTCLTLKKKKCHSGLMQ